MASSDDDDLIDLGTELRSRRPDVDSLMPEEQEHLLDVCLPKFEQKLSLTKRKEARCNDNDNAHVLVTLGHDRVVPVSKRIDVVSSDTIKRIRNITKNLEPVISAAAAASSSSDDVDGSRTLIDEEEEEEESFESQQINSAFDFLSELMDEDFDGIERSGNNRGARSLSYRRGQFDHQVEFNDDNRPKLDSPSSSSAPDANSLDYSCEPSTSEGVSGRSCTRLIRYLYHFFILIIVGMNIVSLHLSRLKMQKYNNVVVVVQLI